MTPPLIHLKSWPYQKFAPKSLSSFLPFLEKRRDLKGKVERVDYSFGAARGEVGRREGGVGFHITHLL